MDNDSAIELVYNSEHHQRSKYFDRRHFFVRERVGTNDTIVLTVIFSADNLADSFTKLLALRSFLPMRDILINVAH
eukprot:1368505-Pleurochrysis_carterae.AAC.2